MIKPFILPNKKDILDLSKVIYISYPQWTNIPHISGAIESWRFNIKLNCDGNIVDLEFVYKYKWVQDEYYTEGLEARETGIDGKKKAEEACKADYYAIQSELIGL